MQKEIWHYSSDLETHTVETHIYRLRKKIKDQFNDQNFILSYKDGYSIKMKKKNFVARELEHKNLDQE